MTEIQLAEVAFPIPLRRVFDYRIPSSLEGTVRPGHRVWAPFGKRARQMGIVLRLHEPEAGGHSPLLLKELDGLVEPVPGLSGRDLALAHWMSQRYSCSLGETLFTVFPLGKRRPPKRPSRDTPRASETPTSFRTRPTINPTPLPNIPPAIGPGVPHPSAFPPCKGWPLLEKQKCTVVCHLRRP
jgi:primosomal protein N'